MVTTRDSASIRGEAAAAIPIGLLIVAAGETQEEFVASLDGLPLAIRLAGSAKEALDLLEEEHGFQVVLCDQALPEMKGCELLQVLLERWPELQVVFVASPDELRGLRDMFPRTGHFRCLCRPWDDGCLAMNVLGAHQEHRIREENARLIAEIEAQKLLLEKKVQERTSLLSKAKLEWERSFDAIRDPLAIVDEKYCISRANLAYAALAKMHITKVVGSPCFAALFGRASPCEGCLVDRALSRRESQGFSCRQAGREFRVAAHWLPASKAQHVRAIVYYRDFTEDAMYERRLIQTEKLAALGQLAGGVAHEINNPMAGILAFTQMMIQDPGRTEDDLEQLGYIESSTQRCIRIVKSLLSFSRPSSNDGDGRVDVEALFSDVRVLLQALVKGTSIELKFSVEPGLTTIPGDFNALTQVVLNLVANGAQAVGDSGEVCTSIIRTAEGVRLVIEDTGPGIPEKHRHCLFDPFFTTKAEGEGTGLGLSISHRIIDAHDGAIHVDRSPRLGGARFSVDLPQSEDPGEQA